MKNGDVLRVLIFSDLHAHEFSSFSYTDPKTGLNSRLKWCIKTIDHVRNEAKKRKIDHVWFGGDLFHVRGVLRVTVIQEVYKALRRLAKVATVTVIGGNHDQQDKEGKYLASSVLSRRRIRIVDTYNVLPEYPDTAAFAYDWNADRLRANIKKAYGQGIRHLLMHAGILGAVTGPRDFIPKEEIKPDVFKKFRRVFSGHYHKGQDIGSNISYIGAALQHYRSEAGYDTGFVVYDYGTNGYERFRIPSPRFTKWESEDDDDKVAGNYVDAVLPSDWSVEDLQTHLEDLGVEAHNVIYSNRESRPTERRLRIDTSTDNAVMLKRYAKKFCGDLDLKTLVEVGRELIKGEG